MKKYSITIEDTSKNTISLYYLREGNLPGRYWLSEEEATNIMTNLLLDNSDHLLEIDDDVLDGLLSDEEYTNSCGTDTSWYRGEGIYDFNTMEYYNFNPLRDAVEEDSHIWYQVIPYDESLEPAW